MIGFFKIFIIFIIYSFIGYVAEIICVSYENKKLTNRGFLCGPLCPIYGVGAIFMWLLLKRYYHDIFAIFLLGALIASVIEYITGWALEKIFHNKWWDYSEHKFHLNGRVCMSNALLFGVGAIFVVEYSYIYLDGILNKFPVAFLIVLGWALLIAFALDLIYSWIVAFNLRNNIIVVDKLKNEKLNNIPGIIEKSINKRINSLKIIPNRVIKNFPNFISKYHFEFTLINKLKNKRKRK